MYYVLSETKHKHAPKILMKDLKKNINHKKILKIWVC